MALPSSQKQGPISVKPATPQLRSRTPREKSLLSTNQLVILFLLLVVPSYALSKQSEAFHVSLLLAVPAFTSLISYLLCYSDKQKAKRGSWRTPESTLHLFEILGGWPGSFVAQKQFRHKTSKGSYQSIFWGIIFLYQIVSFDSLQNWSWFHSLERIVHSIRA